jgi:hypothetical protein
MHGCSSGRTDLQCIQHESDRCLAVLQAGLQCLQHQSDRFMDDLLVGQVYSVSSIKVIDVWMLLR